MIVHCLYMLTQFMLLYTTLCCHNWGWVLKVYNFRIKTMFGAYIYPQLYMYNVGGILSY